MILSKKTRELSHQKQSARAFRPRRMVLLITETTNGPSVDVVLLPVEGGVGLDDDVFVRVLFEFVHQHGLAGF
jgi:hypothetical protein